MIKILLAIILLCLPLQAQGISPAILAGSFATNESAAWAAGATWYCGWEEGADAIANTGATKEIVWDYNTETYLDRTESGLRGKGIVYTGTTTQYSCLYETISADALCSMRLRAKLTTDGLANSDSSEIASLRDGTGLCARLEFYKNASGNLYFRLSYGGGGTQYDCLVAISVRGRLVCHWIISFLFLR